MLLAPVSPGNRGRARAKVISSLTATPPVRESATRLRPGGNYRRGLVQHRLLRTSRPPRVHRSRESIWPWWLSVTFCPLLEYTNCQYRECAPLPR